MAAKSARSVRSGQNPPLSLFQPHRRHACTLEGPVPRVSASFRPSVVASTEPTGSKPSRATKSDAQAQTACWCVCVSAPGFSIKPLPYTAVCSFVRDLSAVAVESSSSSYRAAAISRTAIFHRRPSCRLDGERPHLLTLLSHAVCCHIVHMSATASLKALVGV